MIQFSLKYVFILCFIILLVQCEDDATYSELEKEYDGNSIDLLWNNSPASSMKILVMLDAKTSSKHSVGDISSLIVGKMLTANSISWTVPNDSEHHLRHVISHEKGYVVYEYSIEADDRDFYKMHSNPVINKDLVLLENFKGYRVMVVKNDACYLVFDTFVQS